MLRPTLHMHFACTGRPLTLRSARRLFSPHPVVLHREGPEEPDQAEQRLKEGKEAVVFAEMAPDRASDQVRLRETQDADNQGHCRLETKRADRQPPTPAPAIGKTDGGCQVAERCERAEIDRHIVDDIRLEEELI